MIEVDRLTKHYGPIAAIQDVSFSVPKGAIVGFLGPNGAGKTTAMRILACFMPASSGTARVAGYDVFEHSIEVRKRIGYLPENVPLYDWAAPVKVKIETIATRMYGAERVVYSKRAEAQIAQAEALGYGGLPICMAKTQRSLSDDPTLLGRPRDFVVTVGEVRISAGAGFLVPITGDIMTMPGLPRTPSAERVDVDAEGGITGLI